MHPAAGLGDPLVDGLVGEEAVVCPAAGDLLPGEAVLVGEDVDAAAVLLEVERPAEAAVFQRGEAGVVGGGSRRSGGGVDRGQLPAQVAAKEVVGGQVVFEHIDPQAVKDHKDHVAGAFLQGLVQFGQGGVGVLHPVVAQDGGDGPQQAVGVVGKDDGFFGLHGRSPPFPWARRPGANRSFSPGAVEGGDERRK